MDDRRNWSLEELVRRAGLALAGSARAGRYHGPPNGRVRGLPDQRAIRWYITIGLLDRPHGGRGRGARYGVRHLRQLVAVKLLQSQGLPLAEIQERLTGISDAGLAALAPIPPEVLDPPVLDEPVPPATLPAGVAAARPVDGVPRPAASRRFWVTAPLPPRAPAADGDGHPVVEPLGGLRLAPGVFLVLSVLPDPADLPALAEAAGPLLAALTDRGLLLPPAPATGSTEEGAHR